MEKAIQFPNLIIPLDQPSSYKDRQFKGTTEEWVDGLLKTTTLYVGNLSFYTTEEQIHELFSRCGEIKRIVMGLDSLKKTPCGFCFVEYYTRKATSDCMRFINGTKLDNRVIRTDLDPGFKEGRQFGRGKSGGQIRDEHRNTYDEGRGGWGHARARQAEMQQKSFMHAYGSISTMAGGQDLSINSRLGGPVVDRKRNKRGADSLEDDGRYDDGYSKRMRSDRFSDNSNRTLGDESAKNYENENRDGDNADE
ncbi:Nuclear cap-binding protein subunit 2B [Zancudomyces culisetae]|uniref:Nuclear cap-binding protein subunit 2 n=1 Tax=Zancudomyces culisetae TaxID=1213189 RepID=A0A1R1PST7_ZANCU|nr:Nuclear cap-binding protein subunit 2B [Zancudomyces culisetae]|eukprot:OMH84011.1 Nuclear cap-binding protein subunit 2B [Zancudomyces culisetae]